MLADRKFMPKAGLLAATWTQNHAETGFLQEIARSPLPEKNRFPQDLCHRLRLGFSRLPAYPFFKIGSNSRRKSIQAAADAELETAP